MALAASSGTTTVPAPMPGAGDARGQAAPAREPGLHAGDGRGVDQGNAHARCRRHRLRYTAAIDCARLVANRPPAMHSMPAQHTARGPNRSASMPRAGAEHEVDQPGQAEHQRHVGPLRRELGGERPEEGGE